MVSKLKTLFLCVALLGIAWGAPAPEEEIVEEDAAIDVRIRGGKNSVDKQFPYAVSLQQASNNNKFCGGVIIDAKWVLTAAHCFDEATEKDDIRCFAGSVDGQDYMGDESQLIKIAKYYIHKDYDKNNEDDKGDIALVKLTRPFQLSKFVQPATLPPKGYKLASDGIVFGWGATTRNQEEPSRYLKHTTLNIIDDSKCKAVFKGYGDRQFCVIGQSPNAACQGDSGGPLMQIEKSTGTPYVAGVISFGSVDCGTGPTVFTKVTDYLDWIETTRKNNA